MSPPRFYVWKITTCIIALALTFAVAPSANAKGADILPAQPVELLASSGPIAATGVVSRNGIPTSDGVVVARIWPTADELAKVPEGAPADVRTIAKVATANDGSFQVSLDPTAVPATHRDAGGNIALELWALLEGREIPWNISVADVSTKSSNQASSGSMWSTSKSAQTTKPQTSRIRFNFGANPSVLDESDPAAAWVNEAGEAQGIHAPGLINGAVAVAAPPTNCWAAIPAGGEWLYNNRERFLNVYAWEGAKAKVQQAVASSSTHTVGVAYKPTNGNWGVDGTVSSSISTEFGQTSGPLVDSGVYNSINYREWNCSLAASPTVIIGKQIRPAGYYDIFNEPYERLAHKVFRKGCATKSAGNEFWKSEGTNATRSVGISTPYLNLSAQSGYNEGTKMLFQVTARSEICGNTDQGWPQAPEVDIREYGTR
ncbi:hypothetical protein [Nonomuraea endophytica]|uniref:hypothetical protein n=1 Tax=Nonomuraea endophytica TaxID=714136 RepID=UPI0037C86354